MVYTIAARGVCGFAAVAGDGVDWRRVQRGATLPGIDQKEMDAQMMQEMQVLDDQDVISNFDALKDLPQPVQADFIVESNLNETSFSSPRGGDQTMKVK